MIIRRLLQLICGLALYGLAAALLVRSDLGLSPWHIFHQGVSKATGISFGMVVNLTGAALLIVWIPLRQRLGIGTILNVMLIGTTADLSLMLLPPITSLLARTAMLVAGIVLTGMACGIYIGAGLEPGPRDGLMTGIARCTGWSIRFSRTAVELGALAIGVALGGTVGIGTVAYALLIGPLAQFFLAKFALKAPSTDEGYVKSADIPRATRNLHDAPNIGSE